MRRISCWLGHSWSLPEPVDTGEKESLWRGCRKCGLQQTMSITGHWRYWSGRR